ncbi:hypothetical protein [Nocardioides marmotae]|uniref:Uncharacterized protein n=1 Tax=Nocardioides marmotae TaxID=2663857 RepID=A0A6I3JFZ9_9ACTN|nr:hypothetical protein [Nocardioides marmotae]MBC9734088.1 hypothetical protein [Nocardioides marmotae]MCR6033335.1 hypothetical protein [Gordonia jinghuaiqii]MTB85191.1 hypothetical protein [Nocardioides marmotae]MTB96992.1 hypothetical protein [Nocardioides marmotae]
MDVDPGGPGGSKLVLLSVWVVAEGWRRYDDDRDSRVYRPIGGPTFVLVLAAAAAAVTQVVALAVR